MGTHPIFESDFDCLTEMIRLANFRISAIRSKSTKSKNQLIRASDLSKVEEKPLLEKAYYDNTDYLKKARVKYELGSKKFRESFRGIFILVFLGLITTIKRYREEYEGLNLSLKIQEKEWYRLEPVLKPFTSDGHISDVKNITLEDIELISRNGFLWNTDIPWWFGDGKSTKDELGILLYKEPQLQHRIELFVGLVEYFEKTFLTGAEKELRIISERMTGDQDATDEISDDQIQVNLWKLQLEIAIKNKIEKIKNPFQGVRDTRSIEKPKMWTSKVVTEFMMLIRKYPALFHYIINVNLEKDLNEIIKITKHQDVALLINLIENRANHNFQLRQDLYNLLKGGDGLVDFIVHPDIGIIEAAKLIDQSEAGEYKTRVSNNCRKIFKLYIVYKLQELKR